MTPASSSGGGSSAGAVDVVWAAGYRTGAAHGHRRAAAVFVAHATAALAAAPADPATGRFLRAVAGAARAAATWPPKVVDPGPSRYDRRLAQHAAAGRRSGSPWAAAAVAWSRAARVGRQDAAWSAAGTVIATVTDLLGPDVLGTTRVAGLPAGRWLNRVDAAACAAADATGPVIGPAAGSVTGRCAADLDGVGAGCAA